MLLQLALTVNCDGGSPNFPPHRTGDKETTPGIGLGANNRICVFFSHLASFGMVVFSVSRPIPFVRDSS